MEKQQVKFSLKGFISALLMIMTVTAASGASSGTDEEALDEFLSLADIASRALIQEVPPESESPGQPRLRQHTQHFIDSYAVRALAVAYDLTGRKRYWEACRHWTDQMLRYQSKMIPEGAYYMGYGRKPEESKGNWFVADCSSIAMAVLATAVRCTDESRRKRYLDSARSFAELVMQNWVRESGGITDGFWPKSDKEWWCSSALFAAFAFQMYGLTGEEKYKKVALDAVDWLLDFEYNGTILYEFEKGAPTTIFYILEAYAAGLPYFEPGSARQKAVFTRFSQTTEWIIWNQTKEGWWDYDPNNWGVKLNGFPCHLLIYLHHVADTSRRKLESIAPSGETLPFEKLVSNSVDRAFKYLITHGPEKTVFTQQVAFAMMSFAEKLSPDELYHKKSAVFPYKRYSEKELIRIHQKRQGRKRK